MKIIIFLHDSPYGSERCFSGILLAETLTLDAPDSEVTVFLMGDAVHSAKAGQVPRSDQPNLEKLLKSFIEGGGAVYACSSCMDSRGVTGDELIYGAWQGTYREAARLVASADRVIGF